jgi:hypothetical protein
MWDAHTKAYDKELLQPKQISNNFGPKAELCPTVAGRQMPRGTAEDIELKASLGESGRGRKRKAKSCMENITLEMASKSAGIPHLVLLIGSRKTEH